MKILVPVDGSAVSLDAVRHVIALADQGLELTVVLANVQEPSTLYEIVVVHDAQALARLSAAAGAHTLIAAQALLEGAQISFQSEIATGDPAHTLIDILERFGADLVVMGSSGSGSLRNAVMGSVANEVLRVAAVPVVIVKSSQMDDDDPEGLKDSAETQPDALTNLEGESTGSS